MVLKFYLKKIFFLIFVNIDNKQKATPLIKHTNIICINIIDKYRTAFLY